MPRSLGVRQLRSRRCGCEKCRKQYPTPERRPTKECSGSWQARWYKPDGTRDQSTREKRDDALADRTRALAAIAEGRWQDPKRGMITLAGWRKTWLKGRAVEDGTASRVESHWRAHVEPAWGGTPLRAISHQEVQNWVTGLRADGLAPVTVHNILGALRMMLAAAKRDQRIFVDPCEGIFIKPDKGKVSISAKPPSIEQVQEIAAHIKPAGRGRNLGNLYGRLPLILLETGLRWGEATGLLPDALDLEVGDLTVRRVLEEISGHCRLRDYPKSEAGFRTVPLTRAARILFAEHVAEQPTTEGRPVFRSPHGSWLRRNDYRNRVWLPAVVESGVHLERVLASGLKEHWPTPHDIRHTFASRLENAGVPESVLKEVLGHEKPKDDVTWRYKHAPEEARAIVLAALGDDPGQPLRVVRRLRLAG